MRLNIRCDVCGHTQRTERHFFRPQTVLLICHGCEMPLKVDLTAATFERHVFQRVMA